MKLVFGEGNPLSPIVFIGEAPGKQEEEQGKPFVGKAGKNLSSFLEVLEYDRSEIYITNAVKFRPTKISPKGTVSNRTPTTKEIDEMMPFLHRELSIISPKIVVTLGNTPLYSVLMDKSIKIGDVHGTAIPASTGDTKFILVPFYHPAAIIYNRALEDEYKKDLQRLIEIRKSIQF